MSKRYTLAIVTQFPVDTSTPRGGVEAVSVNLVRFLAKHTDIKVEVVTLNREVAAYDRSEWEGATVHRLPRPNGGELRNALGSSSRVLTRFLDELKPDIVHAHDTYGMMLQNHAAPRVFTVHGFIYGDTLLSERNFPRLRSLIWEYFEKSSWAKQPNVISISPYVRERVAPLSKAKIYDIENPISDRFFDLPRQEQGQVLFSSATISPRKNPHVLVQAIKQLVGLGYNPKLRLAGGVTNEVYAQRMFEMIEREGLSAHVDILGNISVDQVMTELSGVVMYVLVSLEENSPMGIEEAMAAGVPVVTSNRCGMPYMVRNNETGYLVDPHSVDDVTNKIRKLLDDDALRTRLGANAKAFARAWYHPVEVARRTREVYDEILGG